jgi:hypothetical protein
MLTIVFTKKIYIYIYIYWYIQKKCIIINVLSSIIEYITVTISIIESLCRCWWGMVSHILFVYVAWCFQKSLYWVLTLFWFFSVFNIDIYKKMHYYKCPKLNNRVKSMLMNKKLNNYLFMLFLVNKLYHVCILIFIVILFYLMLRKHLKKSKNKTIFQLKRTFIIMHFFLYISIYIYIPYIYIFFFWKDNCQHKYYSYKELIWLSICSFGFLWSIIITISIIESLCRCWA